MAPEDQKSMHLQRLEDSNGADLRLINALGKVRQGALEKKMLNNTFEAGMCMKTKDRKTQCPNRNRLIVPRFRHLRRIERYFAENCCF